MLKLLNNSVATREDFLELAKNIENRIIPCEKIDRQADGDIRYWDLDFKSDKLMQKLADLAMEQYYKHAGVEPNAIVGMYNTIESERSPGGSGGGWHRDSIHTQFKMFVLLSDVTSIANGAFVVYPQTSRLWFKILSLPLVLIGIKRRYSELFLLPLNWLGFKKCYFTGDAGSMAFCDTSAIHRGTPITQGSRQMLTFYLFREIPDHMKM